MELILICSGWLGIDVKERTVSDLRNSKAETGPAIDDE
jgi:hypothetical protein